MARQRRTKTKGLLERWDERNQRVVERQNRKELERHERLADAVLQVRTPDGRSLEIRAQPSGYPFRGDASGDALDFVVFPIVMLVAWARHRYQFKRGWSVAVLQERRFPPWEKILRLERFTTEREAIDRARELAEQLAREPNLR